MSRAEDRRRSIARDQYLTIRKYSEAALKLPESGVTWTNDEVGLDKGPLSAFSHHGVIVSVGRDEDDTVPQRNIWRTAHGVSDWVDRHLDEPEYTPCGNATGIRTLEAGRVYTCSSDDCDCRMSREEAEEVLA